MKEQIIYDESGFAVGAVSKADSDHSGAMEAFEAFSGFLEKNVTGFITRDSGKREEYETGARRDTGEGKGRFDLVPSTPLRRLAKLYERGARKYGDRNWEKGIPLWRYIDSAARHLNQLKEGDRVEDHASAVVFNMFGYIFTEEKILDGELPRSLADGCPWFPEGK